MARGRQAAAIGNALAARVAHVTKALTLEVTARLVEACPVDTGHARANFVPHVGGAYEGPPDEGAAQAAGQAAVLNYKLGDGDVHISNNVPYLKFLILGSSAQAPAGWDLAAVHQAVETVRSQIDDLDVSAEGYQVRIAPPEGEP